MHWEMHSWITLNMISALYSKITISMSVWSVGKHVTAHDEGTSSMFFLQAQRNTSVLLHDVLLCQHRPHKSHAFPQNGNL